MSRYSPVVIKKRTKHSQYKKWGQPKIEIMKWTHADIRILEEKIKLLENEKKNQSIYEKEKANKKV